MGKITSEASEAKGDKHVHAGPHQRSIKRLSILKQLYLFSRRSLILDVIIAKNV